MGTLFRNSLLKIPSATTWNILDKILSQSVSVTHNKLYIFSEDRVHPDLISKIYKFHGSLEPFILCSGIQLHEYSHVDDIDLFLSPFEHDSEYLKNLQSQMLHWNKTKFMHINVDLENERPEKLNLVNKKMYNYGVLGGTFDSLHIGHKLLLTAASSICSDKLLIGITHEDLLKNKKLVELLQAFDVRQSEIKQFMKIINPKLTVETVAISDPIGPAGTDANLDVLIVSKETEGGIALVNDARKSEGLNQLNSYTVDLIFPMDSNEKISSSFCRKSLLGCLIDHGDIPWLRRCNKPNLKQGKIPYVIGLTGGICSGKSTISDYLKNKDIPTIDCDKLGHLAYKPGAAAFNNVVSEFGETILDENGFINRKFLGAIVFSDPNKMNRLNEIVWPCIADMVHEEISKSEAEVIVVEAAIMLEAGWQSFVDEVWVMTVSPTEAINRLATRNNLSEEDAVKRLTSQMSNTQRCRFADIIICSDWDVDTTRSFMNQAWDGLQERLIYYKKSQYSDTPCKRWKYLFNQDTDRGWPEEFCRSEKSRSFLDIALRSVDETLHISKNKCDVLYIAFFFIATTLHVKNSSMRAYEAMFKMFKESNSLAPELADEIMNNIKLSKSMEKKSVPSTQFNLLFYDIWTKANIFCLDEGDQRILPSIDSVEDMVKEYNAANVDHILRLLGNDKHIFKTDFFRKRNEANARKKLKSDLENLIIVGGSSVTDEVKSKISGYSLLEY